MKRGFTLIELMIVIAIIAIIAAIAIPNLIEARKGGNETSAIGSLKTIISAQGLYRERNIGGTSPAEYATNLGNLGDATLIDSVLSGGTKSGYAFGLAGTTFTWTATAEPADASQGDRYFFADQSGVIRFNNGASATATSSAID